MGGIRHVEINKKKNVNSDISDKDDDDEGDNDDFYNEKKSDSSENEDSSSGEYNNRDSHTESDSDVDDDDNHQKSDDSERSNQESNQIKINDNKRDSVKQTTSTKSVNFDSLLKAVIEINDKIEDKERQLKKLGENSSKSKHKNSRSVSRPRTAVLQYRDESEYSTFDANDSDIESVPSIISRASSSKRQHQTSLKSQQSSGLSPASRMNMSFSNEKVKSIDAENQRLLKNLLHTKSNQNPPAVMRKKPQTRVKSASSINRNKRQQEIERENLRLLHRLQSVKPSNALTRNALLSDHSKQEQYSGRIGRGSRPSSAVSTSTKHFAGRSRPSSSYSSSRNFDDTASVLSASSTRSRRDARNNLTRENLERQRNWNDRW